MKRIASLILALVMVFSLAITASAVNITVKGDNKITTLVGRSFAAYKLLNAESYKGYVEDANGTFYRNIEDNTYTKATPADADKAKYEMDGENYVMYRQETKYVYTVPVEWKAFFSGYFGIATTVEDFDAQVVAKIALLKDATPDDGNPRNEALNEFASAALKYAKSTDENPAVAERIPATDKTTVEASATTATFNGLADGYYIIEDTTPSANIPEGQIGSALLVDTAITGGNDLEITIKADTTTVEKNIITGTDADGKPVKEKTTNGAIGDYVQFELSTTVPDMFGYHGFNFRMVDILDKGMTYVADGTGGVTTHDMVVKLGTEILTKLTTDPVPDFVKDTTNDKVYTLTSDVVEQAHVTNGTIQVGTANVTVTEENLGDTVIVVDFPYMYEGNWAKDTEIVATYYGQINQNATFTTTGYPNEVEVEYSNKPDTDGEPMGETPKSVVEVFTGDFSLLKIDDKGASLAGAIFKLEGTALNQSLVTSAVYTKSDDGEWYKLKGELGYTKVKPTELTAASYEMKDGTTEVKKENAQKYTLTSATNLVPQNPKAAEETVSITAEVDASGILKFDGLAAGEYVITEIKAPAGYNKIDKPIYVELKVNYTDTDSDNVLDTATWTLHEGTMGDDNNITYSNTPIADRKIVVMNQAGQELPSTGGVGTTMFYVIGATMMLAAVVLLITKKRIAE